MLVKSTYSMTPKVYQIAILECNELDTNYFFDCLAGSQGMVFFLKRNH